MTRQDYSHEIKYMPSTTVRVVLVICGTLAVITGIIGIFVPVLPTTPFMILAAACYGRSSRRFYNWIMNTRMFGPIIREWRQYRSIPLRVKYIAIFLLLATFGSSIIFFVPNVYLKFSLAFLCLTMIVFMWRIPVREVDDRS